MEETMKPEIKKGTKSESQNSNSCQYCCGKPIC